MGRTTYEHGSLPIVGHGAAAADFVWRWSVREGESESVRWWMVVEVGRCRAPKKFWQEILKLEVANGGK